MCGMRAVGMYDVHGACVREKWVCSGLCMHVVRCGRQRRDGRAGGGAQCGVVRAREVCAAWVRHALRVRVLRVLRALRSAVALWIECGRARHLLGVRGGRGDEQESREKLSQVTGCDSQSQRE